MKHITLILSLLVLVSCSSEGGEKEVPKKQTALEKKAEKTENIQLKGDLYTEYYPGGKNKKFEGRVDKDGKRMGLWTNYLENGDVHSQAEYLHDVLHGIMIVKHPTGAIYYSGEFKHGKKIGVWTFRKEDGSVNYTKDYDKE